MSREYDVLILGAGAAGCFCAIHAAQAGLRVALIERNTDIGAKIRVSGGGRCNFTHLNAAPDNYLSANPPFCRSALARFSAQDTLIWFETRGITAEEKSCGQLFARQRARGIIAVLHRELEKSGVSLITACDVKQHEYIDGMYYLYSNQGTFTAPLWVIATGGPSFAKLGGGDFALRVGKQYGIKNIPFKPGLVPLTLATPYRSLSGVSCEVIIQTDNAPAFRDDLLFTHRGLSGPAVLQISSYFHKGNAVIINFLPHCPADMLLHAKQCSPRRTLVQLLREHLPNALADYLAGEFAPLQQPLGAYRHAALADINQRLQHYLFYPCGTEGMNKAEVCTGGIDTREINPKTFMVKKQPGLYFIGEALDVTGWLGGYNFQWAWASGWCCAQMLPSVKSW